MPLNSSETIYKGNAYPVTGSRKRNNILLFSMSKSITEIRVGWVYYARILEFREAGDHL